MSLRLNRAAYEQLVAEDIAWLEQQPRTLERDHIIDIVSQSPEKYYGRKADTGDQITAVAPAEKAERLKRFSESVGVLRGGNNHPDRCVCQRKETGPFADTPHIHYSEPPYECARCACKAYEPEIPSRSAAPQVEQEKEFPGFADWRLGPRPETEEELKDRAARLADIIAGAKRHGQLEHQHSGSGIAPQHGLSEGCEQDGSGVRGEPSCGGSHGGSGDVHARRQGEPVSERAGDTGTTGRDSQATVGRYEDGWRDALTALAGATRKVLAPESLKSLITALSAGLPVVGREVSAGDQGTHPAPESRETTSRSTSDAHGAPQEPETKA